MTRNRRPDFCSLQSEISCPEVRRRKTEYGRLVPSFNCKNMSLYVNIFLRQNLNIMFTTSTKCDINKKL